MKKLMILVSAVALSGTMFAQKAGSDNPFSLEGAMNVSKDGISWAAPNLRMRYFIKDNLALRLTLGREGSSVTEDVSTIVYDANGTPSVVTSEETVKSSSMQIGLGGEYHLAGTDRLSPYFSGGFMLGTSTAPGGESFGVNLGAGIDYYVVENVYLGVELGLNLATTDGTRTTGFAGGSAVRMGWRF